VRPKSLLTVMAVLLVFAAGAWFAWSSGLIPDVLSPTRTEPCSIEDPCRIRIAFAFTEEGRRAMTPATPEELALVAPCVRSGADPALCLLRRVAQDDVAALTTAFRRSGLIEERDGRASLSFEAQVVEEAIDGGPQMRIDIRSNHGAPPEFNRSLMNWLPDSRGLRRQAPEANIAIVFSGLRGPAGECFANSLASRGYVTSPACLLRGYHRKPVAAAHRIMALHEVGHLFGAFHNDFGDPQPCRDAARSGHSTTACAWEQCKGRTCTREELMFAKDAFCTLVGQYNYNRGPTGRSFCRAHEGGEDGTGWIYEYSHPGKCRTPGFEAFDCGDATHDAVSAMRKRAPFVASRKAGRW